MKGSCSPDIVVLNGRIITVDGGDSVAEAVAVKGGRFVAVGSTREIRDLAGKGSEVIDLGGKTAMPGIIDSHTHPSNLAARLMEVDLRAPPVKGVADVLRMIGDRARELGPGKWVRAANYNDSKLAEGRQVTRWELDEVAPDNPVFIVSDTGHQAVVNSRALDVAGVADDAPDPPGGEIERDAEGRATGLLYENATHLVRDCIPEYTVDELRESYRDVIRQFCEWGVTCTHDASGHRNGVRAFKQLLDEGDRRLRMRLMMSVNRDEPGDVLDALRLCGVESGLGDEWLSVMSVKIMGDGSGAGGTCCVYEPQNRGPKGLGLWMTEPEAVEGLVLRAHEAGLRVSIHSIGDRGIDMALDAIEKAQRARPVPDMRHRIEHNSLCTPRQLRRIKELGVTPSSSIGYMYGLGDQYADNFGPERSRWLHPHRTMKEMGIVAGGNSDCPVTFYSPFVQIYEAVTRRSSSGRVVGPEEAVGVLDAIRVYTWNGAYLGKDEGLLGSVEPGKLADLIVLDRDILGCPVEEIKDIRVVMTLVGGRVVHRA